MRPSNRHFWGPLLLLAALLLANLAFTQGFAHLSVRDGRIYGVLIDIVRNASPVMLLAVGMTIVIAHGGIDLSVGSTMALAAAAASLLVVEHRWPFAAALPAALAIGAACGFLNGAMVRLAGLQPIVATLVTLIALRGIAQTLTGDQKVQFSDAAFESFATGAWLGLPRPLFLAAGAALLASFTLRRTAPGLHLQAVGDSPTAAACCGLPIGPLTLAAYAVSGVCAATAGLIAAGEIGEADVAGCGQYLELDAILAVVIGGTPLTGGRARIWGSLVGALVMQTLSTSLRMHNVLTEHTLLVKGAAVLIVCLAQNPAAAASLTRLLSPRRGKGHA